MRTPKQARQLAKQIHAKAGQRIAGACEGTIVPVAFLAALVSVENAKLNERATRFEAHVFAELKQLRAGTRKPYNNLRQCDVAFMEDAALRNLATSWGLTQIMGWSVVKMLACSIADLRDPKQHFDLAVKRLLIVAARQLAAKNYSAALRIWNTGKARGITHDPDYVTNALAVLREYELLPQVTVAPVCEPESTSDLQPPTSDLSGELLTRGTQAAVRGVNKATLLKGAKAVLPLLLGLSLPVKLALAAALIFLIYLAFKHRTKWMPLAGTALLSLDLKGE